MVKIVQLFVVTVFLITVEIFCSKLIGNILSEYYENESVKSFRQEWVKYREGFESSVMTNIQENYGAKSMNIYMRHVRNTLRITRGFYFSDNIVNVLFTDMVLRDWPNLVMPEVSLCPPGNILKVEATLGKMFVDTAYIMMRNESAVLYSVAELDKTKHSPFSLQQVHRERKLTITAEDCFLSGFSIVKLLGNTVALGHSTFRLVDCKFTVEISSDIGTPPVIAPYFPKGPGKQIENLLSAPLRDELVHNLQGAMYSYINTSVVFGSEMPKYRLNQQKLFKQTSTYMSDLCERLNNLTLEEQKGSIALSDFEERLETKTDEKRTSTYLSLKELKLYGLDTAYASHTGGSFEASPLSIAEGIRFHTLQIRGTAFYDNGTESHTHNFAAELTDFAVNVIVNIEKEESKSVHKFEVIFAKTFDFSILPWETGSKERLWYQALVNGYIINEVPARLTEHLSRVLTPAANNEDQEELKFNEENSRSDEVTKNIKIPSEDISRPDSTKEETSKETDDDGMGEESSQNIEKLAGKAEDSDIGFMVTAPEALIGNSDGADEEKLGGSDADDVEAPVSDVQISNDKKDVAQSDAALDSNFFSNEKEKDELFSGIISELDDKEKLADDKMDDALDEKFFSDDNEKEPFFSDAGNEKISGGEGERDAVKSEEGGDNNPTKPEDDANNNPEISENKEEQEPILIFASPENDRGERNDENAEQSVQQSVPIERTGKKSHGIANNETVNKKKLIKRTHKRNKMESNNLKLILRRNPRANTTKSQVQKTATQRHKTQDKHIQKSKIHNSTGVVHNELHMSDNEIR